MSHLKHGCVVLICAILLECFYFNFTFFNRVLFQHSRMSTQVLDDFETVSWRYHETGMISENDAQLIFAGLNEEVGEFTVYLDSMPLPKYIDFFYTNEDHPFFTGDSLIRVECHGKNIIKIPVHTEVQNYRLDLGDDPGVVLTSLRVVKDESSFSFSFSRVLTVVLIWLVGTFLFGMQKMPDYHLERFYNPSDGENPENQAKKPHQCQ